LAHISVAQTLTHSSQKTLDAEQFIGIDSFNNTYTINGMDVLKNGPLGSYRYTDFQLGNINSVDIINPMNVVVFYGDTNTVVLLDNRLNAIERVNFNSVLEFANITAARNAGGNKVWVFNADSQQLELYNYRTATKRIISLPISEIVTHQTSNFNYYYILTPTSIKVYTIFGGIVKTIPFENGEKLIQHRDTVIILKENSLYKISENKEEVVALKTPEISIQDLQLSQDFLYIYDRKNVHAFTLSKPKK
jgi:hypothetical protein